MAKINVLCIQMCSKPNDKDYNLKLAQDLIEKNIQKGTDLVMLPEFFNTGVDHQAFLDSAEPEGDVTSQLLSDIAKKYKTNIIGGAIIEKDGEKLYNTSYAFDRNGEIAAKYRKIHLFNYFGGTEGDCITAGDKTVVADLDIGAVGMSICFDIRYPMHFRKLLLQGAQIMVCPTAWCYLNSMGDNGAADAKHIWRAMNITRALENLAFFVSCNQAGPVNNFVSAIGNSMIIGPVGEICAEADNLQSAIKAQIDTNSVKKLRKSCPINEIE